MRIIAGMTTPELFRELLGPMGQNALTAATHLQPTTTTYPAAIDRLRKHYGTELSRAAVEQVLLRIKAADKFGSDAARMYFTREGLEMASRPEASRHRAARFIGFGRVADLGCGLGADLIALARVGCTVVGIERSPLPAAMAEANLRALGLPGSVVVGDVLDFDFSTVDAAFADPSRRPGGGRVLSVEDGEPPLAAYLRRIPATFPLLVKAAPGLPRTDLDAYRQAEAEFVSVQRELKECVLAFGPLRRFQRGIVELPAGTMLRGEPGEPQEFDALGAYLCDPHPAVPRADLLEALTKECGAWAFEPGLAMLTSREPIVHPFLGCRRILGTTKADAKAIQVLLRDHGIGRVTLVKRGSNIDAETMRSKFKPHGDAAAHLVFTKVQGKNAAILTADVPQAQVAVFEAVLTVEDVAKRNGLG